MIGDIFIGREDIMRRLEELWSVSEQAPSIVLYGHRRMGKTSILQNLQACMGSHTTVINFNLQLFGNVCNTNELLYALAIEIYDRLPLEQQQKLQEPSITQFTDYNPYQTLIRFLKKLDQIRDGQRFIIAIDEFELLEKLIEDAIVDKELIRFWRGLIQTYPWFIMIFAGLHTLNEMQQNYWSPFFSSVTAIPVSFLSFGAAQRLITQPFPDFELEYSPEVVQKICNLTNGQPYLIQLIGRALVTRYNRQVFEERQQRSKRFNLGDLESVVNSPEFYRDGDAYFSGVWRQAMTSQPLGQLDVLCELCVTELSQVQLFRAVNLGIEETHAVLKTLRRHDVIKKDNDNYSYTVELMRRWVQRSQLNF